MLVSWKNKCLLLTNAYCFFCLIWSSFEYWEEKSKVNFAKGYVDMLSIIGGLE